VDSEIDVRRGSTNPVQKHGDFAIGIDHSRLAAYLRDLACDHDRLAGEGLEVLRVDARGLFRHGFWESGGGYGGMSRSRMGVLVLICAEVEYAVLSRLCFMLCRWLFSLTVERAWG
jgi:hypothetical protein